MIILVLLCISSGCKNLTGEINQDDPIRALYSADKSVRSIVSPAEKVNYITLSAYKMPLSLFCRILSDRYSIGLVYSDTLSEKQITAEFKHTDLKSVLAVLSRQIGVDVVRIGNTYFVGEAKPEDRSVLVRRVVGYDDNELSKLVQSMLSSKGKVSSLSNSVVVATDHDSVLRRVAEMLDYLDQVDPGCWILQLYFVSLKKDALLDAGLETKSSGTISYDISNNRVDLSDLKLEGLFQLNASTSFIDTYASPMLLVRDGHESSWKDGKRVPVPRKSVSDYGTVTTTGFDYVDTGFSVKASIRQSRRGGRLDLEIGISDIDGYVEYSPITKDAVYKISSDLVQGKIYLLGELSTFKYRDATQSIFVGTADRGKSSLQVWGKLYRLGVADSVSDPEYIPRPEFQKLRENASKNLAGKDSGADEMLAK